jgi:uncharacterized protein YndB with AHSA1/START domain
MTTRSVTRSVEIAAPLESVWRALTDATELVRWFPLEAGVEPGDGGSISMGWADGHWSQGRIITWDPGRRLQYVGVEGPWKGIVTDYHLETEKGKTIVRVVTSGFEGLEDWEDVVGAFGRGWDFELKGLRHYLEKHQGRDRLVARARVSYRRSIERAWSRIAGARGWLGSRGLGNLENSPRYSVTLATGEVLSGAVHNWQPPHQFSGTAEEFNDGLFRVQLWNREVSVWLSTYGLAEKSVRELEQRWQKSLNEIAL